MNNGEHAHVGNPVCNSSIFIQHHGKHDSCSDRAGRVRRQNRSDPELHNLNRFHVIHSNKKTKLGSFHLRQVLGLIISGFAFGVVAFVLAFIPIIGWLAIMLIWLGFFVLWLMGLIAAATGQMKPVPVLGESYQKWFSSTFE